MHGVVFYPYADDHRIIVRVVKASCILLWESDYGAFPSCYLRHWARQLNILDHAEVSLPSFFGWPSDCRSSHDHSYVPYGGSRSLIIPSGVLLLRGLIRFLLSDEPLQLSLFNKGFNLLFQIVTISRVITVVSVEAAILILRASVGISLQLPEVSQRFLVFDLH